MIKYVAILLSFVCLTNINAQTCTGSVGQNIFDGGDFGTGPSGVLSPDPMIAPGYSYTFSVPADGQYTIATNTSTLANLYPTWIRIPDNSGGSNGYMMVVNASFQPGIFYEQQISGLCENTLYEFTADIINLISRPTTGHIKPNVAFLIDDVLEYQTGEVAQDAEWTTYGFSFTTPPGQTSVKLTLRNNAPGGIGNDLALDNITFRPCGPSAFVDVEADKTIFLCIDDSPINIVASIEDGTNIEYFVRWQTSPDSLNWVDINGATSQSIIHDQFAPGDYYYRYFSSSNISNLENSKCRVVSDVVKITVLPLTYEVQDTICEGSSYTFGEQSLNTTGIYSSTESSSFGCDSLTTLSLVVVEDMGIEIDAWANDPRCNGDGNGSIEILGVTGAYDPVQILANQSPVFNELSAGIFDLTAVDRHGCATSERIELIDPPIFSISIGNDTTVRLGVTIERVASGTFPIEDIVWTYESGEGCSSCLDNTILAYSSSTVSAVATNAAGCMAEANILVTVDEDSSIYLPNIFSPNDDGSNDEMIASLFASSVEELVSFKVYDRWGNLLESTGPILKPGASVPLWDGRVMGQQPVKNGVYVYQLSIRLINNVVVNKVGSVTVLR